MSPPGQQLERIAKRRNTQQLHGGAWQQSELQQASPEAWLTSDSDYCHGLTDCDLVERHSAGLVQLKSKFNLGSRFRRQAGWKPGFEKKRLIKQPNRQECGAAAPWRNGIRSGFKIRGRKASRFDPGRSYKPY